MVFVVPRRKKESSEVEGVLKGVMSKSRKYQKSLPTVTKRSREVYLIDPTLKVHRVAGPEHLYGKNYEIEIVLCRVESRYD